VQEVLQRTGVVDDAGGAKCRKGWTVETTSGVFIPGSVAYVTSKETHEDPQEHMWDGVSSNKSISAVKTCPDLKKLFMALADGRGLVDGTPITPRTFSPQYAWLRVKAPGECTPEHSDAFYFLDYTTMFSPAQDDSGRPPALQSLACRHCGGGDREDELVICDECNCCIHLDCLTPALPAPPDDNWYCPDCSPRPALVSCWTPLGDVRVAEGVLCVLAGSHKMPNFDIPDKKRPQIPAAYKNHGKNLTWATTDFKAGDVVLFNSKVVHCSSRNYEKGFRISLDTRWVLAPQQRPNFGSTVPSRFILDNSVSISGDNP
jgi:hypothetical protein